MNCSCSWQLCFVLFVAPLPAIWQVATHNPDSLERFDIFIVFKWSEFGSTWCEHLVEPHSDLHFIAPALWHLPGLLVQGDPIIERAPLWNIEICNNTMLYTYLIYLAVWLTMLGPKHNTKHFHNLQSPFVLFSNRVSAMATHLAKIHSPDYNNMASWSTRVHIGSLASGSSQLKSCNGMTMDAIQWKWATLAESLGDTLPGGTWECAHKVPQKPWTTKSRTAPNWRKKNACKTESPSPSLPAPPPSSSYIYTNLYMCIYMYIAIYIYILSTI